MDGDGASTVVVVAGATEGPAIDATVAVMAGARPIVAWTVNPLEEPPLFPSESAAALADAGHCRTTTTADDACAVAAGGGCDGAALRALARDGAATAASGTAA